MAENLSWSFELQDQLTGPANAMLQALQRIEKQLGAVGTALNQQQRAVASTAESTSALTNSWSTFTTGLASGYGLISRVTDQLLGLGEAAVTKVFDFEKGAVDALSFKENTLASFQTILGSAKEAQDFFNTAALFGKFTPYETQEVVKQFKQLLGAGFSKEEVPIVFQAVGDVAAMSGFSTDVMNRLTYAFTEIKAMGTLQERQLRMVMIDAAQGGVGNKDITAALARNLGVAPDQVRGLIESGQVSADAAIYSIVETMRDKAGGGVLGGGMMAQQDTFSGVLSTLKSGFSDFFLTLDGNATDVQGFNVLKGAMINLRSMLDTNTVAGKQLQDTVVTAFNRITTAIFGAFQGSDGLANMQAIAEKAANAFGNIAEVVGIAFEAAFTGATSFAEALGLTTGGANELFDGPLSPTRIEEIRNAMMNFGRDVGTALGQAAHAFQELLDVANKAETLLNFVGGRGVSEDKDKQIDKAFAQAWFGEKGAGAGKEGVDWFLPGKKYGVEKYLGDMEPVRAGLSQLPGTGGGDGGVQTNYFSIDASGNGDPETAANRIKDGLASPNMSKEIRKYSLQLGAR